MARTPGPWHIALPGGPQGPFYGLVNSQGLVVATQIVGEANAHLISASPDLLDALKDCRNELFKRIDRLTADMPDDVRQKYLQFPPIVKADAAIAKAEGCEP